MTSFPSTGVPYFPQTLAAKTLVGRTDTGAGPTEAISWDTFILAAFVTPYAPFYPVIQPSSGNLQGSGTPTIHGLVWSDSNPVFWADLMELNSTDPSAIATITVTGSPTTGTLSLQFQYGSNTITISVGVTTGQTTTQVAAAIVAAIQANTTLFSPASSTRLGGGGYDLGCQIGYITNTANVVAYDYDMRNSTQIAYTAGTTALTLTFGAGQSTTSTNYALPTAWDNNPVYSVSRFVTGYAPPANSIIFGLEVASNDSSSLTARNVIYGTLEHQVISSTHGALSSRWGLVTTNTTGTQNQGLYIGAGAYTVGVADTGVDTINTNAYWLNTAYTISKSGSTLRIDTLSTGDPVVVAAKTGLGMTPTGQLDINGYATSFGTSNAPTTGSGFSIFGGSSPGTIAFNWATSAYLASSHLALSWDFKPSNSSTSGITISANLLRPDADNATTLGDGSHNWSTVFAKAISGLTTPLSTAQGGTGNANGAVVLGGYVSTVNLNSATTDNAITISSPTTNYRVQAVLIRNKGSTASLTTATAGLFTSTGGGGLALAADQALSAITSNAIGTDANLFQMTITVGARTAISSATLQFRVGTAQGAAATADVYVYINPFP